jgi:hypothetical protein
MPADLGGSSVKYTLNVKGRNLDGLVAYLGTLKGK